MNEKLEFVDLVAPERRRTYIYADGKTVTFDNVVKVCTRPSGTHRLETSDGKKHIILRSFLAISLDMDKWTF